MHLNDDLHLLWSLNKTYLDNYTALGPQTASVYGSETTGFSSRPDPFQSYHTA